MYTHVALQVEEHEDGWMAALYDQHGTPIITQREFKSAEAAISWGRQEAKKYTADPPVVTLGRLLYTSIASAAAFGMLLGVLVASSIDANISIALRALIAAPLALLIIGWAIQMSPRDQDGD